MVAQGEIPGEAQNDHEKEKYITLVCSTGAGLYDYYRNGESATYTARGSSDRRIRAFLPMDVSSNRGVSSYGRSSNSQPSRGPLRSTGRSLHRGTPTAEKPPSQIAYMIAVCYLVIVATISESAVRHVHSLLPHSCSFCCTPRFRPSRRLSPWTSGQRSVSAPSCAPFRGPSRVNGWIAINPMVTQ